MISMVFDLRAKFIVALCVSTMTFAIYDILLFISVIFPLFIYLALQEQWIFALKRVVAAGVLLTLFLILQNMGIINNVYAVVCLLILRLIPLSMVLGPLFDENPADVIGALEKLRFPRPLFMPITFMLRFYPTVKKDFSTIVNALKIRGILSIRKPLLTLEYTLVPILIRSSLVADRLSAAAETRGISRPGLHTTIREMTFKTRDYVLVFFSTLLTIIYFLIEKGADILW